MPADVPTGDVAALDRLRRRPTLRDVAERASVSVKTVSRVVNEESGVSHGVAERVREVVADLGYQPHLGASSLRRSAGGSSSVALLLEDVANPYSSALQRAVEDAAPTGVAVLSASLDNDPAREIELVRVLGGRRPDGLLIMPCAPDQGHLERDRLAGTALVAVDREARGLSIDCVTSDSFSGACAAVTHLFSAGHRRVAHLGDRSFLATAQDRQAGYVRAHERHGLPVDPRLVVMELHDPLRIAAAVRTLLGSADPPTALFTSQNGITMSAVREVHRLGREHEVAMVGFDDFPMADVLSPGVTVVAQDLSRIGGLAAEMLFARIAGDNRPARTIALPTRLLPRGSGEIGPPPKV